MAKQILQVESRPHLLLYFRGLVLTVLVLALAGAGLAQEQRLSTRKIESASLERTMPYNVIVPNGYADKANAERKYPVLYLLHGLTGHYGNWADDSKLLEYSAPYDLIIVMPEGNNGWYTNAMNVPADRYEDFLIKDLIPEIEGKFRARTDREGRMIAGLSMGGYGALKFGLKYPDRFALAGSFSGALDAARFDVKMFGSGWKVLTDSIDAVYGPMGSKTRAENDLFKMIEEIKPETVGKLPFIYLDCGTEDILITSNRDFATALLQKKIPHEFTQRPGKHDWDFWKVSTVEFLGLQARLRSDGPSEAAK